MDFAYLTFGLLLLLSSSSAQDPTDASASAAVTFQIEIVPKSGIMFVGKGKFLSCYVTNPDGQKPTITWSVNGKPITNTDDTQRVYVDKSADVQELHISEVKNEDEGTYTCEAELGGMSDSRSISMEVVVPLTVNSKKSQFGLLGEDGTLECDADGKPTPDLVWKFGNRTEIPNNDKYVIKGEKLIISSLTFEDTQRYLCDISIRALGDNMRFYIDYEVVDKPKIVQPPTIEPNNPKEGSEVEIKCQAEGTPKPEYLFLKDTIPVPDAMMDKANGILKIKELKREDEAEYVCKAVNRGGSDTKKVFLDVMIPPTIGDMEDKGDVAEGSSLDVICYAKGDPAPTVTWKKKGMNQAFSEGVQDTGPKFETIGDNLPDAEIKQVGKKMTLYPVKAQDAGVYICTAHNPVGNVSKEVKIDVLYTPHFDTDYKTTKFYGWKGHTTNLTCLVSANEVVSNVKWYRKDPQDPTKWIQVENAAPFTVYDTKVYREHHLSSSSIEVTIGEKPLYQEFNCTATNSIGTASNIVELVEAKTPGPPSLSVTRVLSTKVVLSVTLPVNNGGQEVEGYSYYYYRSGGPAPQNPDIKTINSQGSQTRLDITDLKANKTYNIHVMAKNPVGAGEAAREEVTTLKVSVPVRLTINSDMMGSKPEEYEVTWATPDDSGSAIEKFELLYSEVTVTGDTPEEWTVKTTVGTEMKVEKMGPRARSILLEDLKRDTHYSVRLHAKNSEGWSDYEERIFKTSKGAEGEDEKEIEIIEKKEDEKKEEEMKKGEGGEKNEEGGEIVASTSDADGDSSSDSAGMGSGTVLGIIIALVVIILIIVAVIVVVLRRKPELAERIRGRLGGKGGEEERGKADDGKEAAEQEKLIKKDDTVKVENETGDSANDQVIEEKPEEFEPETKPEAKADAPKTDASADAAPPAQAPTEIKVIPPETPPEKSETNPV